jgi:hypothetical protein
MSGRGGAPSECARVFWVFYHPGRKATWLESVQACASC